MAKTITPSSIFLDFLKVHNVLVVEPESAEYSRCIQSPVRKLVDLYFDRLSEPVLRSLVESALKERDRGSTKSLGLWGDIIDAVKIVTLERRTRSESSLRFLLQVCNDVDEGRDTQEVINDKRRKAVTTACVALHAKVFCGQLSY